MNKKRSDWSHNLKPCGHTTIHC